MVVDDAAAEGSRVAIMDEETGEVRGMTNSKDSVLMQELVHGQRSVRGHPKARSELGAMEHQNFLFGMEMIRP
ncbi:hypothetical protein B296_00023409 [Ensete ventricosum]|uniref:Uncharacterized protein n=1 Tax=Ensete ventricosum TaxID=4639 RepID=A0A427AQF8_ENSVE|nr:hypothetical protein B296_00023409 [Ensete ventricosum]